MTSDKKKIESLIEENIQLKNTIHELNNKLGEAISQLDKYKEYVKSHEYRIQMVSEYEIELKERISQARQLQKQYKDSVQEIKGLHKGYENRLRILIHKFKRSFK